MCISKILFKVFLSCVCVCLVMAACAGSVPFDFSVGKVSGSTVSAPTIATSSSSAISKSVTLSCATSGASIYYTTDGTTPTTSSSLYSSAITVSGLGVSKTISAVALLDTTYSTVSTETVSIGSMTAMDLSYPTVTSFSSSLSLLYGITSDGTNLYACDYAACCIYQIDSSGNNTVLAGSGTAGITDGNGTMASFNYPHGITTDGTNLYVTDEGSQRIRQIVIATGEVTTLVSSGLSLPHGITTDGTVLYVVDSSSNVIRRVDIATKAVTVFAGIGGAGSSDGAGTTEASFYTPVGITTDGTYLYVTDAFYGSIRTIRISDAYVSTIADIEAAPRYITTDGANLYWVNSTSSSIDTCSVSGGLYTTVGSGYTNPYGIVIDGAGLYFTATTEVYVVN